MLDVASISRTRSIVSRSNVIRVAAVQVTATKDRDRNLEHARGLMTKAVNKGAKLIAPFADLP